jgi:ribosome-associated toxin RatA of RatAB toxin-antitoxin module
MARKIGCCAVGTLTGSASAEVDAPQERCYEIAADVDGIASWQEGVVGVDVLERDAEGRALVAEISSDAKIRTVKARVRFSYDPPNGLRWVQEKGDLKSLEGSWSFAESGGVTTATYALEIDPGRVLGMLVRGPVEGRVRELMVAARPKQLKQRAEAG